MAAPLDSALTTSPFDSREALCLVGESGSGKTAALVTRALAWGGHLGASSLSSSPAFLFFCASPTTVDKVDTLLGERAEHQGLVSTPFDYALRILADPEAQRLTGRTPRVLSAAEEAVFFEDLKTSGLKRRRLRELWAFLLCGKANLDDSDPRWIQTTEEQGQLDLAEDILRFDDAMLAGEVVNRAVAVLRQNDALRKRFSSPVVLADDVPLMSRASQALVDLLAREKIVVAGDEHPAPAAFEPYPNAAGLLEFCNSHHPVERVVLEAPLRTRERLWKEAESLPQEMALVAAEVQQAIDEGVAAERIAVVGTNRPWRANLMRALKGCGIPVRELRRPHLGELGGTGPRDTESERQRVLTQLASNPDDSPAWRQWLSFGDALARSAAVSELRSAALAQDLTLAEALRCLRNGTLDGLSAASPFGRSLLSSYEEALSRLRDEAVSRCVGEESPALEKAVALGAPEDLYGGTFDVVIFGGFVNGFIPARDLCDEGVVVGKARERALQTDRALIRLAVSRSSQRIVFTSFANCPLETAEQLKLSVARIRLQNGERICSISPSSYRSELGLALDRATTLGDPAL